MYASLSLILHSFVTPAAPCPPAQLMVDSSCESNNISVSWQASRGSVSYMAVAENAEGLRWSCNTSSTTCQIPGLPCGQQYQIYATGVDEKCIGAKSNIEVIRTGRYLDPSLSKSCLGCLWSIETAHTINQLNYKSLLQVSHIPLIKVTMYWI